VTAPDPLFLQVKEADKSVLAAFAGASKYADQGQRVVAGQRLMQASSDIFLGWQRTEAELLSGVWSNLQLTDATGYHQKVQAAIDTF